MKVRASVYKNPHTRPAATSLELPPGTTCTLNHGNCRAHFVHHPCTERDWAVMAECRFTRKLAVAPKSECGIA